jgi:hypothetical protein
MPIFLFINLAAELAAAYIVLYVPAWNTLYIYNILVPLSSLFYGYTLYHLCTSHRKKMFIRYGTAAFALYALINFLFIEGPNNFNMHAAIIGWTLIAICCYLCLDEYFRNDESSPLAKAGFWIAAGLLLYNSGNSLCFSLYEYIKNNNLTFIGEKLYNIVPRLLSVVMYSAFAYAFILCRLRNHPISP